MSNYYLVRVIDNKPNSICVPALFMKEDGKSLYTIRDIQFSLTAKSGTLLQFLLVKTDYRPGKLINFLKGLSTPEEIENNKDIQLIQKYDYICEPMNPLQNSLRMKYYAMNESEYYLCFPEINLRT